jgi:GalNAc-alpha-(1->4)-GalNAc-alpha-(1->3)-diNAcBac-PP-undecaprenol alpha-1,4-N-acetyl-D-galactosaminyltransferase
MRLDDEVETAATPGHDADADLGPAPRAPRPRRITFVISSLVAGGAERVLTIMADWWVAHGVEVVVVDFVSPDTTPFIPLDPRIREVRLDLLRPSRGPVDGLLQNLRRLSVVRRAIRGSRPDVVIAFMDKTNVLVLTAMAGTRTPVIVEEHADPSQAGIGRIWELLRRVTYRRAARVVALTRTSLDFFDGPIRRRGAIIPNPLAVPPVTAVRAGSSGKTDAGHIVSMGRLGHEKGFDRLLRAFALVARERPGWTLAIWGEGDERERLEALRASLGLDGVVQLPGLTREPFAVFAAADMFVLSSRQEGFGNVLVEAMACGLPAVAFDCPSGPREIVTDGVDGLLVPDGDEDALATAMIRLIDDPDLRGRLGSAALAVRERYAPDTIMDLWERLLAGLPRGARV